MSSIIRPEVAKRCHPSWKLDLHPLSDKPIVRSLCRNEATQRAQREFMIKIRILVKQRRLKATKLSPPFGKTCLLYPVYVVDTRHHTIEHEF